MAFFESGNELSGCVKGLELLGYLANNSLSRFRLLYGLVNLSNSSLAHRLYNLHFRALVFLCWRIVDKLHKRSPSMSSSVNGKTRIFF